MWILKWSSERQCLDRAAVTTNDRQKKREKENKNNSTLSVHICMYICLDHIVCSFRIMHLYSATCLVRAGGLMIQARNKSENQSANGVIWHLTSSVSWLPPSFSLMSAGVRVKGAVMGQWRKVSGLFFQKCWSENNKKKKRENVWVCGVRLDMAGNPCWPAFHRESLVDWFRLRPHWLTSIDLSQWGKQWSPAGQ